MSDLIPPRGLKADDFAFDDRTSIAAAMAPATIVEDADAVADVGTAYQMTVGDVFEGALTSPRGHDWVRIELTAGDVIRIDLIGVGVDYLSDPFLRVRDADGDLVEMNDDNLGTRDSHIVYTAGFTGSHYLDVGSFQGRYAGDYRLSVSAIDEATDAPEDASTPFALDPGESFTGRKAGGAAADWIGIRVTEGETYFVKVRMIAADGEAARDAAGEIVTASNRLVASALGDRIDGDDSYFVFTANRTETLYVSLRVAGPGDGYEVSFETYDPVSAVTWREADPIESDPIKVYLYAPGEIADLETNTYRSGDFGAAGRAAVTAVLESIESYVDVRFEMTGDLSEADFRLAISDLGDELLGFMSPQGGGQEVQGAAVFNSDPRYFNEGTLRPGGLMYSTIVHELGHGLGLAHPHDDGGNSLLMQGVRDADGLGRFTLNQDMFTVMSYNTTSFDLGRGFSTDFDAGYMSTLAPFDIAALQRIYGAPGDKGAGDTVYALDRDAAPEAIWDTGGVDRLAVSGSADAVIDLRAATLRNEDGGGGYLSYVGRGLGAKTIANGVVLENATGAAGDDRIAGNDVANRLFGKGGDDRLRGFQDDDRLGGGGGDDSLFGGGDDDILRGGGGRDRLIGGAGSDMIDGGDGRDLAKGGSEADTIFGGADEDRLFGEGGGDVLRGGGGADRLVGGGGDDVLRGGGGQDRLVAGQGFDTVFGGGGADRFVFAAGQGEKTIGDFEDGVDILKINRVGDFGAVTVEAGAGETIVRFAGTILHLTGVDPDGIDAGDFLF